MSLPVKIWMRRGASCSTRTVSTKRTASNDALLVALPVSIAAWDGMDIAGLALFALLASIPATDLAVALRRLADRMEDAEVERALRDGWTWAQVAEALGVTRQAVHKKHARRLRDVPAIRS